MPFHNSPRFQKAKSAGRGVGSAAGSAFRGGKALVQTLDRLTAPKPKKRRRSAPAKTKARTTTRKKGQTGKATGRTQQYQVGYSAGYKAGRKKGCN